MRRSIGLVMFAAGVLLGTETRGGEIHQAVMRGDSAKIEEIVKKSPAALNEAEGQLQNRPLHIAVKMNRAAALKTLLEHRADIEGTNHDGETALHKAALLNRPELVLLLLQHGAKVDALDSHGNTPLMFAALNGHQQVCEQLINKGANVNAKNQYGATVLSADTQSKYPDLAALLQKRGAQVGKP